MLCITATLNASIYREFVDSEYIAGAGDKVGDAPTRRPKLSNSNMDNWGWSDTTVTAWFR